MASLSGNADLFDNGGFLSRTTPKNNPDSRRERAVIGLPLVDVLETPKAYTFFLDVPGLSKSDIQVTVEDDSALVISTNGKRKRDEGEEDGCRYLRLERRAPTRFTRKFRLPEDADAIKARCENGVLTVVVGKRAPPECKATTMEVAVA